MAAKGLTSSLCARGPMLSRFRKKLDGKISRAANARSVKKAATTERRRMPPAELKRSEPTSLRGAFSGSR